MRLKKILMTSACALALGAVTPISQIIHTYPTIVAAQEADLSIEEIKNNLAGQQPVNLEQLLSIDDNALIDAYNRASEQATTNSSTDVWGHLYHIIASENASLNLLTGDDYEAYNRAAQAIVDQSEFSYSDLNTATPRDILTWYRAAFNNNGENVSQTVESILPQISAAREAYMQRRDERQNQGNEQDNNASQETTDLFVSTLTSKTDITKEQLDQFSQEELAAYQELAETHNYDEGSLANVRSSLISQKPEVFSDKQVSEVATNIRQVLLESTPITQEQIEAIDSHSLLKMAYQVNQEGSDPSILFNRLLTEYPDVFDSEVTRIKDTLVKEYQLNKENLDAVAISDLLWNEFTIFQNNNQQEDFASLAQLLQDDYGVGSNESNSQSDSSISESSSSEDTSVWDEYLTSLVSQTDLTQEQVAQLDHNTIESLMNRLGLSIEDTTQEDFNALRDEIVISQPDSFTQDQLTQAIDSVRSAVIQQTPTTESILNEFLDTTLANWYNEAKTNGLDVPTYIFQQITNQYPELFNDLVSQGKATITQNTTITQAQIDQMNFVDILLALQPSESGEVNYVDVTNYLKNIYPDLFNTDTDSSSSSSDASSSSQDQGSSQQSSSVNVSISSTVESNKGTLPNTGERGSTWLLILGALVLVGGGIYLLITNRNKTSKH